VLAHMRLNVARGVERHTGDHNYVTLRPIAFGMSRPLPSIIPECKKYIANFRDDIYVGVTT